MSGRATLAALSLLGCGLLVAPSVLPLGKLLILNATASAPVGLYALEGRQPRVGDLALVTPPPGLARWLAARGYLPANTPLIKRLAAVGGQHVCIRAGQVAIDGRPEGRLLSRDRQGRPLPATTLCRRLARDEVFLLNPAPASLDSRYFGPVSRASVVGRLSPLWTPRARR